MPLQHAPRRPLTTFLLAALCVCASAGPASAASETGGRVAGYVYDPTGAPLAMVPVVLRGGSTLGEPRSRTTSDDGRFEFESVPVGAGYVVEVSVPGFAAVSQANVTVLAGKTTPVDVHIGALTEAQPGATYQIVEKGNPVLDPDSAQAATVFDQDRAERIPLAHNAANLPQLLPGVGPGPSPAVRGGLSRYNRFYVDGFETTDPVTGGFFMPLNFDAVENFEVIVGGFDAQYNSLGAVINTVTKDGDNKLRYDVSLTLSPSFLSATPNYSAGSGAQFGDFVGQSAPAATTTTYLPSVALSGAIIPDKLWFYGTFQALYSDRENPILLPGLAQTNRPTTTTTPLGHVKLTWAPTARDRVSFNVDGERNQVTNQIGNGTVSDEAETKIVRLDGWALANWDHRFEGDVLFQLQGGVLYKKGDSDPASNSATGPSHTDLGSGITTGNAGALSRASPGNFLHELRTSYRLDPTVSWTMRGFGTHQLKGGLQLAYLRDSITTGVVGGARFFDKGGVCNPADPAASAFCFQQVTFPQSGGLDTAASVQTGGVFLQDCWSATQKLTVVAGLRFDYGRLFGQDTLLTNLHGLSPRLALTYDLLADRRTLLLAHYGRSTDVSSTFIAQHGNPSLTQVTASFDKASGKFADCSTLPAPGCSVQGGPLGNYLVPGQTAPHVDEISGGIHHEIVPDAVVGVDVTWRKYSNLWSDQEVNRIWDPTGTKVLGYQDGVAHTVVDTITPDSAQRRYTGVDLWVQGKPGRWDLLGSYTYAQNRGTVTDYLDGYLANPVFAPLYNGALPDDYRHTLKGWASYKTTFGLDVGARLQYRTGHPLWESFVNSGDPSQRAYLSQRGTGFATNPATGLPDFTNPSSIVQLLTPSLLQIDLQARYDLGRFVGKDQRLEALFLVQNVFNDTTATNLQDFYPANGKNFGVATAHNLPLTAQVELRWRN